MIAMRSAATRGDTATARAAWVTERGVLLWSSGRSTAARILVRRGGRCEWEELSATRGSIVRMDRLVTVVVVIVSLASARAVYAQTIPPRAKTPPISVRDLPAAAKTHAVSVHEVNDYVFGNYAGAFTSPPNADGNPRRAFVVTWKDRPERFVFAHEGSYCPWFELPDGSGVCYQFF